MMKACELDQGDWMILAASHLEGDAQTWWEFMPNDLVRRMLWDDFRGILI